MTTPTGPITVEITAGEPETVQINQAPAAELSLSMTVPQGAYVTQAPAPGLTLTTAGPQGPPGSRIISTVGQPSDSTGVAGDYAMDTGAGRLYGPKTTVWPVWSEIAGLTDPGWSFAGAAQIDTIEVNDVYLTRASGGFGGGAAWYNSVQSSILDVSFEMEMGGGSGADGVTFAFANAATPVTFVGGGGGDLGLVGTTAVAVAFDTASGSRARIITTTGASMTTVATYGDPLDFRSAPVNVRVKYDGAKLYCWIDDVQIFNQYITIDPNVRVGWTAANGGSTDNHIIRNSEFLPSGGSSMKGPKGNVGATGPGVPAGGSTGQIIYKNSIDDFDTVWADQVTGVPDGGAVGQVLRKNGTTDGDIAWANKYPSGGTAGQVLKKTGPNDADVAWGSGVPAGGTTNQVLKKVSNADFDAAWAQAPTPVPAGGTNGQVLKKNTATDYDMAWQDDLGLIDPSTTKGDLIVRGTSAAARLPIGANGTVLTADSAATTGVKWAAPDGWFRGDWQADTLYYDQGFSGGSIPAPFTGSHVGSASDPALVATSAVSGTPTGYTSAVKMQIGNINNGHSSTLTLPLASLNISNITRIKLWTGKTDGNIDSSISKNGIAVFSQHQTTYSWTEREFTAASTDTFTFTCFGAYGVNSGTTGGLFVTGIRVYATANPYKAGQFVTYNGTLYRCVIDGNGSTPGVDGNWAEVSVSRLPRYTTAARPAAATTNTGQPILDTTLNQVFFSTGSAWVGIPLSVIPATLVDAKGDLLVGSANDTVSRLAVGTNGQVLTADSTQATGVKWAAVPGGGSLASLTDVNLGTPTDGQSLVYDAATAKWKPVSVSAAAAPGIPTVALDIQPYVMNIFPSGGGGTFNAPGASFNSGSWGYGGGGIMLAPGNVDFPVTVAPGTYNILHMADGDTTRGTVQWQISDFAGTTFTNLGSSYSTVNGSFLANNPKTVMGVTIAESGRRTLRAVCTAGSVGFQRVLLIRAS